MTALSFKPSVFCQKSSFLIRIQDVPSDCILPSGVIAKEELHKFTNLKSGKNCFQNQGLIGRALLHL